MLDYKVLALRDIPDHMDACAAWFHGKWRIPLEAYRQSMEACIRGEAPVPQWYVAMSGGVIIAGLGVIHNDFHNRKDLTPNLCALYVEEAYRGRGIAGCMLRFACGDMATQGIDRLYLLTDHRAFYER